MVFYANLNGFRGVDEIIYANHYKFSDWKSAAAVDLGIINTILSILHNCSISGTELEGFFRKAFIPESYQCHLFSTDECKEILTLDWAGKISSINYKIANAEGRLKQQFGAA